MGQTLLDAGSIAVNETHMVLALLGLEVSGKDEHHTKTCGESWENKQHREL